MATNQEYLEAVLQEQTFADDSPELQALEAEQINVTELLEEAFAESDPTIRLGGSRIKGTMIKENYDLDIVCYFPADESEAGDSLEEIYESTKTALSKQYHVEPRRSALRLQSLEKVDFHIDVVPGRFVDGTAGDCFIHQCKGDKERLKTNLDKHIAHIKGSGVIPAIRLLKLWRTRRSMGIKQFAFELLIISILKDDKGSGLPDQLIKVWETVVDNENPLTVEDPANPTGNDLTSCFEDGRWELLRSEAEVALNQVRNSGWESVFGATGGKAATLDSLRQAAAGVATPTKPWLAD